MTGCFSQQKSKTVLCLVDLLPQVEHGALYLIVRRLHLRYGRFIRHSGIHQGTSRRHGFFPRFFRLPGNGKLFVEHQQRIIGIGYPGYQLGTDSLTIILTLSIKSLRLFLGIAHTAEDVQLPTGSDGQRISLRCLLRIEAAHGSLRSKSKGRQESKFGRHQCCLCFLYTKLGRLIISIGLQSHFNEGLQIRIGEEFPPIHITQTGGVFGHYFPAIKLVGDGSNGLVFSIDATTAQQQAGDS